MLLFGNFPVQKVMILTRASVPVLFARLLPIVVLLFLGDRSLSMHEPIGDIYLIKSRILHSLESVNANCYLKLMFEFD